MFIVASMWWCLLIDKVIWACVQGLYMPVAHPLARAVYQMYVCRLQLKYLNTTFGM
jgi:hypothetical protein